MADDDNQFRFERLEVWQRAADMAFTLGLVVDQLATRHLYRFAEQLRAAALSISNNIAEGSGSNSTNEFRNFLNIARRSAFECASMLLIFQRHQLVLAEEVKKHLNELNQICRMITGLGRSLGLARGKRAKAGSGILTPRSVLPTPH
jgi:four helix bundle protein